jgi:hypothetical protein
VDQGEREGSFSGFGQARQRGSHEWREWSADELGAVGYWWNGVDVALDGSLWAIERQGWGDLDPEDMDPDEANEPWCRGVIHFDGEQLDRFVGDACIDSFEIGPTGSVWTLAQTGPADDPTWDLYVITPEAVGG